MALKLYSMSQPLSYVTAQESMYSGLSIRGKSRMELITVSLPPDSGKEIGECFKLLVSRFSHWTNKWGKKTDVKFFKVEVKQGSNHHNHALIVKPWLNPETLHRMWHEITGADNTHVTCKTVSGDKKNRKVQKRLVQYLVNQGEHHAGAMVSFTRSDNWTAVSGERKVRKVIEGQKVL